MFARLILLAAILALTAPAVADEDEARLPTRAEVMAELAASMALDADAVQPDWDLHDHIGTLRYYLIPILEVGPNAGVLAELASVYRDELQGRTDLENAFEIWLRVAINLSLAYEGAGDREAAIEIMDLAVERFATHVPTSFEEEEALFDHVGRSDIHELLAFGFRELDLPDQARFHFREADRLIVESGEDGVVDLRVDLAGDLLSVGDRSAARRILRDLLDPADDLQQEDDGLRRWIYAEIAEILPLLEGETSLALVESIYRLQGRDDEAVVSLLADSARDLHAAGWAYDAHLFLNRAITLALSNETGIEAETWLDLAELAAETGDCLLAGQLLDLASPLLTAQQFGAAIAELQAGNPDRDILFVGGLGADRAPAGRLLGVQVVCGRARAGLRDFLGRWQLPYRSYDLFGNAYSSSSYRSFLARVDSALPVTRRLEFRRAVAELMPFDEAMPEDDERLWDPDAIAFLALWSHGAREGGQRRQADAALGLAWQLALDFEDEERSILLAQILAALPE